MIRNITLSIFFLVLLCIIVDVIWRSIFVCKGYKMKDIQYKTNNLIIQKLRKGRSNTLVVLGNGWNVSVDNKNYITQHDPFFLLPKGEVKLLSEGNREYEIISAYFPFECNGIEESGIELAKYINKNYKNYKIILLGHSKSAIQFANLSKWLDTKGNVVKIICVSAPFGGVISDEENLSKLNWLEKKLYRKIIVPHKVNDDITKNSNFLENVADYSGLFSRDVYLVRSMVNPHILSPINNFLYYFDNKLGINGDGVVGFNEQYYRCGWTDHIIVDWCHKDSMKKAIKELKKQRVL